jgi:hypothetical protein
MVPGGAFSGNLGIKNRENGRHDIGGIDGVGPVIENPRPFRFGKSLFLLFQG